LLSLLPFLLHALPVTRRASLTRHHQHIPTNSPHLADFRHHISPQGIGLGLDLLTSRVDENGELSNAAVGPRAAHPPSRDPHQCPASLLALVVAGLSIDARKEKTGATWCTRMHGRLGSSACKPDARLVSGNRNSSRAKPTCKKKIRRRRRPAGCCRVKLLRRDLRLPCRVFTCAQTHRIRVNDKGGKHPNHICCHCTPAGRVPMTIRSGYCACMSTHKMRPSGRRQSQPMFSTGRTAQ